MSFSWDEATPFERGEWIRRYARGGRSGNLLQLFQLSNDGLKRILNGDTWRAEYVAEDAHEAYCHPLPANGRR